MRDSAATLARALELHNQGRPGEAASLCREVLAAEPLNGDALHVMGLSLLALGDTPQAVHLIGSAAELKPSNAAVHAHLGTALSVAGHYTEALACYERALARAPDLAEAQRGRGMALMQLGRPEPALARACFERAIALNPRNAEAHHNLGILEAAAGRHHEALASFERALAFAPDQATAHHNRGLALASLGRPAEALASFDRALGLAPSAAPTHLLRGKVALELGRPAEALASFDRAYALAPQQFAAHLDRGVALTRLERHEESLASLNRAVALDASSPEAANNRGAVLVRLFRPAEALADFARAVSLRPDYVEAHTNAGIALRGVGRYQEALASLDRALALRPEDPAASWCKALIKLGRGEFREGWPLYETRLRLEPARRLQRSFEQPCWMGHEPLAGKTLLVHAEQGLGDTLQFCRYIPQLRVSYLHVDAQAVSLWRERLATLPGLKVGLNWYGNPEAEKLAALEARSFPLATAAPLARVPGVSLVSLQKGEGAEQRNQVEFGAAIAQLTDPQHMGPEEIANETAAILMGLDLLITADTALAHLAGALGVRVWVVLQAVPDWRWLIGRADSPWYPTMKLFRQRTPGDWSEVFERVAAELAALCMPEGPQDRGHPEAPMLD